MMVDRGVGGGLCSRFLEERVPGYVMPPHAERARYLTGYITCPCAPRHAAMLQYTVKAWQRESSVAA